MSYTGIISGHTVLKGPVLTFSLTAFPLESPSLFWIMVIMLDTVVVKYNYGFEAQNYLM